MYAKRRSSPLEPRNDASPRNDDRRLSSRETTHRREPRNDAAHRYRRRDDDDELDEHLGDEKQAFATCDLDGDLVLEDVYAGKAV